jgi:hypothetical protein
VTKPLRIQATLEPRGPAAAIVLTDEQVEQLAPGKKAFPVKVTLNGTTLPLRLSRMGNENLIGFSKAKRAEAGVEIGAACRVVIEPDLGERTVDVPADLAAALKAAKLTEQFDALAYSHRKEFVRHVTEAKKPETRERRIAATVAKLREGATR